MSTRVLILADTHVPKRAKALPASLWEAVAKADVVLHAGDWVELALLEQLAKRSRQLIACYGNNDGPEFTARLPLVARSRIEGIELAIIHETGGKQGRETRMDRQFPDVDVLVFGHSHIPWDTTTPRGMRLLNPGSPTDRRRQPHCSYMTALVDGGNISVDLHRL